jgi:TRAP-type C4-dicarboxylate transport system substrate-binding protein
MQTRRKTLLSTMGLAFAGGMIAALLAPAPAALAQSKTFVMKIGLATINDTQHDWVKAFVAAVDKAGGGRIKGEIYPASQLGPIPRMIEGVQFGSVQAWIGPPEFLVGVDKRYEALSAPGLFTSRKQMEGVLKDPAVLDMMMSLGANKGLMGVGLIPIGPSSIIMRKPARRLADFKGAKIRVLASPFQLELIRRMGASPIAMTLADVLPGLQQGTIDGSLSTVTVYTTMQFQDAAKYVTNTGQPMLVSIIVMSKKWFDALPADLQKIVRDEGRKVSAESFPAVQKFFDDQEKIWLSRGGEVIHLPPDELAAITTKVTSIGEDLSKDNPDLNNAVKTAFEAAKKYK